MSRKSEAHRANRGRTSAISRAQWKIINGGTAYRSSLITRTTVYSLLFQLRTRGGIEFTTNSFLLNIPYPSKSILLSLSLSLGWNRQDRRGQQVSRGRFGSILKRRWHNSSNKVRTAGIRGRIYCPEVGTNIKGVDNDLKLSIQLFIRRRNSI